MNFKFSQPGQTLFVCLAFSLCSLKSFSKSTQIVQTGKDVSAGVSFEVVASGNVIVNIQWQTAIEAPRTDMEIERSFDQLDYKTIALVFAPEADYNGTSSYTFKDKSKELSGKKFAWYRIKQIDSTGLVTYSAVKLVDLIPARKEAVKLFPNPFIEKINLEFVNKASGPAKVRMINTNGEEVSSKEVMLHTGKNAIELEGLKSIPNGMYIVELSVEGIVREKIKVIKK